MYQKQTGSIVKHLDFLLLDCVVLECAYILAYICRYGVVNPYSHSVYRIMAALLMIIQFLVVIFQGYYQNILRRGYLVELRCVFEQNILIMFVAVAFMFVTRLTDQFSRQIFITMWIFSFLLMYAERLVWKNVVRKRLRNSTERSHMLVIGGTREELEYCIKALQEEKYQAFYIVGAALYRENARGSQVAGIPVVADWDEIFEYAKREIVDEVFLDLETDEHTLKSIIDNFLEMGITVHINMDWTQTFLPNKVVENIGTCSVLTTSIKTATGSQIFMKRMMDIGGSLVGLVFTGILFIFLAPVIYIQSPGPVFFSQTRVGRNGRKFKIYKFRSMYMDAEERKKELMDQNKMNGLMFKMDNDPRIIPIGKVIRKLSLDEFPQFWNVLKGDMSLVGTRPPTVDEFEQYEAHHKVRLAIKPGLTGMWQVSGRSDITDFEEVVALDNQYIAQWNLRLDIKILWKTVLVVLGNKGAV